MRVLRAVIAAGFLLACAASVHADSWIEPRMTMAPDRGPPTVALTFDACGGRTDERILQVLLAEHVPATIFVTGIWIRRNPKALAIMLANPQLFQIENHGHRHLLAAARDRSLFGLKPAATPEAVAAEIEQGRQDILASTGRLPRWYRGAAAVYTHAGVEIVTHLGQKLAGYSLAPDGGAMQSSRATYRHMLAARDGDVLLLHINHPERPAGQGAADAIRELKSKGYRFVRLDSPGLRFITQPLQKKAGEPAFFFR